MATVNEYVPPKKGTPGGADFGSYTKFGMGMYEGMGAKEQKAAGARPGAGAWAVGIDPRAPDAAAQVERYLARYRNPDGTYHDAKGNPSNWMNRIPGLLAQNPGIDPLAAFDAAYRMQMTESSKPPTNFFTEYLMDPLAQVAAAVIGNYIVPGSGPLWSAALGAGRGASQNGLVGGLLGGISGFGTGKLGLNVMSGVQSAGGVGNYLSNLGTSAYNAVTNLPSTLSEFGSNALDFAKYGPELTNINVPGIMPLDIVGRAEPILHTLEPFIPAAYAGRGVTQAGLLASEPLRNVNQFMPSDIAAHAGTSSVFPAGPPTLEQMAGRGGDAVEPTGSSDTQRPKLPSFGDSSAPMPSIAGGAGVEFGQSQPIMKREFMPLYQGNYGTLQGLLQQQANQTLSNLNYAPRTRPGQRFLNSYTSGLLG